MKSPNSNSTDALTRQPCYGLRIESHAIQLAIAIPEGDQRFRFEFDEVECEYPGGWMSREGAEEFESALGMLIERHDFQRIPVAVSLDGDFCVTRVIMGNHVEVEAELKTLADRIPRYLQLGPGEKVIGSARTTVEPGLEYVVTGVVNKGLIQNIYDAFRNVDVNVAWVEPSLMSLARLIGRDQEIHDRPVLIADGMGKQWDVGIACAGRLLLDYRPAAARNTAGFCDAIISHFSRLKRYCHRHRRIASEELNELLVCGRSEKTQDVFDAFEVSSPLTPRLMEVPHLPDLYTIDEKYRASKHVPPVATVFPLMIGTDASVVPDLFEEVRRAPDLSWRQTLLQQCWPIAVACSVLLIAYGLVTKERRLHGNLVGGRAAMESEIMSTQAKYASLSKQQNELAHLKAISRRLAEPDWNQLLRYIVQSLPPATKIDELRIDHGRSILINGTTTDETLIYDLVNSFRHLPGIRQVALNGTIPNLESQSTRFTIQLTTQQKVTATNSALEGSSFNDSADQWENPGV